MTGKLDLGGAFLFAWTFWATVGWATFGTGFVFMFLSLGVTIIGLICCFVGIYPANAIIQMAAQHLMCQLYRLYLDRGGESLREFKPDRRRRNEYDDEYDDFEDEE